MSATTYCSAKYAYSQSRNRKLAKHALVYSQGQSVRNQRWQQCKVRCSKGTSLIRISALKGAVAFTICGICIAGNDTIASLLHAEVFPSGPFVQSAISSNKDGTYLLTMSSSLAANFLVTLKLGDRAVGNASVAVAPRIADAERSLVTSLEFGVLNPEGVLRLEAGRSYEFETLLFDIFGNRAAEEGVQIILGATLANSSGIRADFVRNLDQGTRR